MSTKVYRAYRIKKSKDLWPVVQDIYVKGEAEVRSVIRNVYQTVMASIDETTPEFQKFRERYPATPENNGHLRYAQGVIRKEYQGQVMSPYRNGFDFDVSVAIRQYQGKMYLIPYCDINMKHALDFLDQDPRLEDFCYWNNTDPLEGVSARAWKARGKVWEALDENWSHLLAVTVCEWNKYYLLDPYDQMVAERRKARG